MKEAAPVAVPMADVILETGSSLAHKAAPAAAAANDGEESFFAMSPLEAVAGGLAGFCEHTAMFPFDTIKTRMQQHVGSGGGHRLGTIETIKAAVKQESVFNLYRGCGPIVLSAVPAHAVYFGLYEAVKRWVGGDASPSQYAIAAAAATTGHDSVSTPFDVVKQRMQVDAQRKFKSSLGCVRHIVTNEGASALFVSLPTTILMNIPQITTHWVVYESCKRYLTEVRLEEEDEHALHFMASGLVAGGCAAVVSAPMDVVKTQLQLGNPIHNPATLARIVYNAGGVRGLFRGVVPRVLFMAPSAAICMTTYETAKGTLEPVFNGGAQAQ